MGYFKLPNVYIFNGVISIVLSMILVFSEGSTFHVNSDVLLDSRLGRTSANTDDSEKRSDGKPGMWFGPRLGRSLHKYPDLDINKWISFEETKSNNLKMSKKYEEEKSTNSDSAQNDDLQYLLSRIYNVPVDSVISSSLETSNPCFSKIPKISNSSELSFLYNLLKQACQRLYSRQQN